MYMALLAEQPDTQRAATVENHEPNSSRESEKTDQRVSRRVNRNKSGWKHFRVDTQLLKYVSASHSFILSPPALLYFLFFFFFSYLGAGDNDLPYFSDH